MNPESINTQIADSETTVAPARKPYQIILIEHLFYPFLGLLFLSLGINYVPKILMVQTDLSPNDIREIAFAINLSILIVFALLYLPFSCRRLWRSSGFYLTSFWKVICRTYAVLLSILATLYGLMASISLPMVYIAAWTI